MCMIRRKSLFRIGLSGGFVSRWGRRYAPGHTWVKGGDSGDGFMYFRNSSEREKERYVGSVGDPDSELE